MKSIVELQRHGDVAVIVVDNPPVNTITAAARAALNGAMDALASQVWARALVLRCEGRNFFTGADIAEFSGPPKEAEFRALYAGAGFALTRIVDTPARLSLIEGVLR